MSRDPESILHEAEYWKAICDDLLALNASICDVARALAPTRVEIFFLRVRSGLSFGLGEAPKNLADQIAEAFAAIERTQDVLIRMISLADGRVKAIRREMGDDDG